MGEFLRNQFISVSKRLLLDFESVQDFTHPGTKGKLREKFIKKFLRKYIPNRFELINGHIVNCHDEESREIDIIVYDAWSAPTLFTADDIAIVPIEAVYAIVEVKSVLNTDGIKKAARAASDIKTMFSSFETDSHETGHYDINIASLLFAYKSSLSEKKLRVR